MYGFNFWAKDGRLLLTSDDNLFRLVHIGTNLPRQGSVNIPFLSGQGEVVVICYGTAWRGGGTSSGGVNFMREYYWVTGDVLNWDIPLTANVGGMLPPLDNITIDNLYVFVR